MAHEEFSRFRSEMTERLARLFEEGGTSPLVGRIYALLICSPEPVSLQELSEQLGVTKAAVSIQVRILERLGHCMKLARGSDRKDYYCIPEQHVKNSIRLVTARLGDEMKWIEDTLRRLPSPEAMTEEEQASLRVLHKRYSEQAAIYRVIFRRLEGVEEEVEQVINGMRDSSANSP